MNLAYPTVPTARQVQAWGNVNPTMYPAPSYRHMGIDLAANVGTSIFAACPGVVNVVNITGAYGYGRHVIIEHGDFMTLYAHLHKILVRTSQTVEAGALIGEMGGDPQDDDKIDGASSGPHLHFEVILPAEPKLDVVRTVLGWSVDPFRYLLNRFAAPAISTGTVIEPEGIRVRISIGTTSKDVIIDALQKNMKFEIAETKDIDLKTQWARIRSLRTEWVCMIYQGRKYVEVQPLAVPDIGREDPAPTEPAMEENVIRLLEVERMIVYLEARKVELSAKESG